MNSNLKRFALVVFCLTCSGALMAGTVSKLYLTAGDDGTWFIAQGGGLTVLPNASGQPEYAIAVADTVRTMNAYQGMIGSEYTLAGVPTGVTYLNTWGSQMIDGTTDGMYNYSVQWSLGTVVRFDRNWANGAIVASGLDGDTLGITYDPNTATFWTASRSSNTISHYSATWALLGSFSAPGGPTGLAFDPADGTLWAIMQGFGNRLDQYSTAGVFLSSETYGGVLGQYNTLGSEFALVIPEPGSALLICGGLLVLPLLRRRFSR